MRAAAHAVALDAGHARILFALDDRHVDELTAECGRRTWLVAEAAVRWCDLGKNQSAKKEGGVAQLQRRPGKENRSDGCIMMVDC
jgi:hypothetical protein